MKQTKGPRFLLVDQEVYQKLNLESCPNFHKSGSKEGMRNKYYGKDAHLLQHDEYIYHVDEDTFEAAKDILYLRTLPKWLQHAAMDAVMADANSYKATYMDKRIENINANMKRNVMDGNEYLNSKLMEDKKAILAEFAVVALAMQSDKAQQMQQRIGTALTDVKLYGRKISDQHFISCTIDGERQPAFKVNATQHRRIANLAPSELHEVIKDMAAQHHSATLFDDGMRYKMKRSH